MKPSINVCHPRESGDPVRARDSRLRGNDIRIVLLAALCMCGIFVSCGSENDVIPAAVSGDLTSPTPTPTPSPLVGEGQGEGVSYSGKVVIKFKDGTDVRLASTGIPFTSPIESVTKIINARITGESSRVSDVRRAMSATEEEVTEWRDYWSRQGVETHDWNLVYYLDVPDEEDAKELVEELTCHSRESGNPECANEIPAFAGMTDIIEYAEILPVFYLTEVTTPDISNEQGYLKSASTGGLGIEETWAMGVTGENVTVVDQEYDWNFDHEILPIDETAEFFAEPSLITWNTWSTENGKGVANNIHHGTAVLGILVGQGGLINKAIKGITPSSTPRLASMASDGYMGSGANVWAEAVVPPGSVYTIEVQRRGVTTVTSGCTVGDGTSSPVVTGCVPIEASNMLFNAIKDSTATGAVIIEGAGNGSVNLNDDAQASPEDPQYFSHYNQMSNGTPVNDSGAIMVGASLGADKRKAPWSNCGDRVDVFAWGSGVVTAGYGDNPVSTGDINNPDNPTSYTSQFGGTSAATAQVAGVAALVQSYVRKLVEDAGFVGKTVYLDSKQIRQILKFGGQAAVYGQTEGDPNPNCNIGVQPNAVQAIAAAEDFVNNNTVKIVPLNANVVSGIRYDMDGDGKAELISFSRDKKWYVDLSTIGPNADHFGEWDVILSPPEAGEGSSLSNITFPVVADYNSDGRADLALYDSVNGKYYIKYTSSVILSASEGSSEALVWDRVIDYSTDPAWKAYSRPLPGDINNDRWLDISFQTPDGYWLIDFGGMDGIVISSEGEAIPSVQYLDHFGTIEKSGKYLTDDQLDDAPGWAWLPVLGGWDIKKILAKTPDGIQNQNAIIDAYFLDDGTITTFSFTTYVAAFGNNDSYFVVAGFHDKNGLYEYGFKNPDGTWSYAKWLGGASWKSGPIISPNPQGYGDLLCRPIPADYDGDGKDDRAVQCGTSWKIAYSTQPGTFREIELDSASDPLPAYVYSGGIKYTDQVSLFTYYKTKLTCSDGEKCGVSDTIFDVRPPIGPYFAECVAYWAPNASYCWDK